jgi:plasmid stabilization system protein ParE
VNVRISARAQREAERRDKWWREHRPEAVDLFRVELADAIDLLRNNPSAGTRYEAVRFDAIVRRILLPETETHVYHAQVDDDVVVVAIWGARRGRGPKL